MKSFTILFQELLALWLILVIAEHSCAIFYTKSDDPDSNYPRIGRRAFFTKSTDNYPRIGRRAFFTGGNKGSSYPRIGRSGPSPFHEDDESSDVISHLLSAAKRGIFTSGAGSYPRIGRSGEQRTEAGESQAELPTAEALMTSVSAPEVGQGSSEEVEVPLGLLFFAWDKNGDKTLSRSEFKEGMARARADGSACR